MRDDEPGNEPGNGQTAGDQTPNDSEARAGDAAASANLGKQVGSKEARKIQARREPDRTLWFGLGTFGLVGWSVAIPTVLGVGLGVWLDLIIPGEFSWTLALLLAGATLGCLNAWYWINQQQEAMDRERERQKHD